MYSGLKSVSVVWILLFVSGPQGTQEDSYQSTKPFWSVPERKLDLQAAEIELVREPRVSTNLATLPSQPIDYVPTSSILKPFIETGGPGCDVIDGGLDVGATPYTDRKFRITKLPDKLTGLTLLQTKMGHKAIVDARYAIILSSAEPCYCFLAIDTRSIKVYKRVGTPFWLEEFSPTGYRIFTDNPVEKRAGASYSVYVRKVSGGRIALGPSCSGLGTTMYFAFFGRFE